MFTLIQVKMRSFFLELVSRSKIILLLILLLASSVSEIFAVADTGAGETVSGDNLMVIKCCVIKLERHLRADESKTLRIWNNSKAVVCKVIPL